jgi:hypothetical protein
MVKQDRLYQLDALSASLALEVAHDLREVSDILSAHGITEAEFELIRKSPQFVEMVNTLRAEWASLKSTQQRIRAKAQLALEEGIIQLHSMLVSPQMNPVARVAAAKELKELAGMAVRQQEAETTTTTGPTLPSITIVVGQDSIVVSNAKALSQEKVIDAAPDSYTVSAPDKAKDA